VCLSKKDSDWIMKTLRRNVRNIERSGVCQRITANVLKTALLKNYGEMDIKVP